jgi:hypothetical protein
LIPAWRNSSKVLGRSVEPRRGQVRGALSPVRVKWYVQMRLSWREQKPAVEDRQRAEHGRQMPQDTTGGREYGDDADCRALAPEHRLREGTRLAGRGNEHHPG